MKRTARKALSFRINLSFSFIFIILSLLLLSGCASTGLLKSGYSPQTISVEETFSVKLYNSTNELRGAYMYSGGDPGKMRRVKGFYSEETNTIHCMKWDFYTCGHELFHVLQLKGDKTLIAEKGYEHFRGTDFASE
jgi:hypothetical protein